MSDTRPAVYVLCGPTASGKTALSLRFAQAHGCEILCMDSMQIYRGMDIGTAKPTAAEQALVPHHLLDIADPGVPFSVAEWQRQAETCMAQLLRRGVTPLLVGGTGLYLRALLHPMAMGDTAGDEAFRAEMEAIAAREGGREQLHRQLASVDAETAARLHVNDTRRVIRALEVYRLTGVPFSRQSQPAQQLPYRWRVVALDVPRGVLYPRIDRRVEQMMEAGLLEEVRGLLRSGVPADSQAMHAIGYRELCAHLAGEMTLPQAVAAIAQNTRHYAKRQFTWFRREPMAQWLDATDPEAFTRLEEMLLCRQDGATEV